MLAVTAYSIFLKDWKYEGVEQKGYEMITQSSDNMTLFIVGNILAFFVAMLAIKVFIGLIDKYGFRIWGWYRIIAGTILLIYFTR
jgi:undecaprenyl-diphosphatase